MYKDVKLKMKALNPIRLIIKQPLRDTPEELLCNDGYQKDAALHLLLRFYGVDQRKEVPYLEDI